MNVYVAEQDYVVATKGRPFIWQAQMTIAPTLKKAKEWIPRGDKREVKLLYKDIDKPIVVNFNKAKGK